MTEIKGPFGTLRIEVDEVDESTALGTDAFKTQSVAGWTEYRLNGKTIGPMDAASIAVGEVERLRGLLRDLEWAGGVDSMDPGSGGSCPACHRYDTFGHMDDCWLAAELANQPAIRPASPDPPEGEQP
jgi:hypothetical protein